MLALDQTYTQDEIVAALISSGMKPEDFDDTVLTVAQQNASGDLNAFDDDQDQDAIIDEAEAVAAEMNTSGFPAQVLFITESLGFEDGKKVIEQVAKSLLH